MSSSEDSKNIWNDVKKIGGLFFDQSKEQKDIMLLKLRIISYNSKRDNSYTRLGELVFKAHKENKETAMKDEHVLKQIEGLVSTEKEIAEVNELMGELLKKSETGRKSMNESLGEAWEKTKTGLSNLSKDEGKPEKKEVAGKEVETKKKTTGKQQEKKGKAASPKQDKKAP